MATHKKQVVIFTDLDGTLLDADSYSWEEARPALDLIKERAIPLILCSSKTRAEIEVIRKLLVNYDPFISENGGGIFIPNGYFNFPLPFHRKTRNYQVIALGTPYDRLREALKAIAKETGAELMGYGDLSAGEIAAHSGLSIEAARLAKQREYDEPFILIGSQEQRRRVIQTIEQLGLSWTKGSRYDHLTGANDKGKAVNILRGLFEEKFGRVTTVALGDSPNDLPMLAAVDYPILVQRPGGGHEESIQLPGLVRAGGIGPEGWRSAILKLLAYHAD